MNWSVCRRVVIVSLCLGMMATVSASHHSWVTTEAFSNADGTLQFIEMSSNVANDFNLNCCSAFSDNLDAGTSQEFVFPNNPTASQDRTILLATPGFEAAFGITPDYLIPEGFLHTGSGQFDYNAPLTWTSLPTDGFQSFNVGGIVAAATPTNFNGDTVTLSPPDTTDPTIENLPPAPLTIESNSVVSSMDAAVTSFFANITCSDNADPTPDLVIDFPADFDVDTTTDVALTCSDDAGNSADASVPVSITSFLDTDSDGIGNDTDPDDDNDGVLDVSDDFPLDSTETIDTDGDGTGNNADTDDDNDGTADTLDDFPLDDSETTDTDGDGIGNNADPDDDNDMTPDNEDAFPTDPQETLDTDGDGVGNNADLDDDGDSVADTEDAFPLDASESTDTDNDGIGNNTDTDDDNDGVPDTEDAFPLDPTRSVDDATDTDMDGEPDVSDNCIDIANASQTDTDGDGQGDACDNDDDNDLVPDANDDLPLDANESVDTDGDGIGNNADTDDDNDSIPDAVEIENALDPLNPDDAQLDADMDGVNNADEHAAGSNIWVDDYGPVITLETPITFIATGRLTALDAAVTAVDARDGDRPVVSNKPLLFDPGEHIVTWESSDVTGNITVREQVVRVTPLVAIAAGRVVAEGSTLSIPIVLNGLAHEPSVAVSLSFSGTASEGVDYTVITPLPLVFENSLEQVIDIDIIDDGVADGEETMIVSISGTSGAVPDDDSSATFTIVETNLAPIVDMSVSQQGEPRSTVVTTDGLVLLGANAMDPNSDLLTYSWIAEAPIALANANLSDTSFSPAGLDPGSYRIEVTVSDGTLITHAATTLSVVANQPSLTNDLDTDGDGTSDLVEGFSDDDGDGVENYLDSTNDPSLLALSPGDTQHIETPAGQQLVLGDVARASGLRGALMTTEDLAQLSDTGALPDNTVDPGFRAELGIFDMTVNDVYPANDALTQGVTHIVLPLSDEIPVGAQYRKYAIDEGWQPFIITSQDQLASASSSPGACPSPRDDSWVSGLNPGHYCVRLTISDGGPNDADGMTNTSVVDPGAVVTPDDPPVLTVPTTLNLEAAGPNGISTSLQAVSDFSTAASCADSLDGPLPVAVTSPIDLDDTTQMIPLPGITVRFSCTDSAASEVMEDVLLGVVDTTAPSLTAPPSLTISTETSLDVSDSRVQTFLATASCTDLVDGALDVESDTPTSIALGDTAISFSCQDGAGNLSESAVTLTLALPPLPPEQSSEGAGCFIATAAYGSYLSPEVQTLRDFRDDHLIGHPIGDMIVSFYYDVSPPMAETIANNEGLRSVTRFALTPLVYSIRHPVAATALAFLMVAFVVYRRKLRQQRSGHQTS
ncbi:MAG: CFI-box-CTERM domain-containing protein [Pseudomonadota bacterium]